MSQHTLEVPLHPPGTHVCQAPTRNGKDGSVWKYRVPLFMNFDADKVDAMRRSAAARREHYLALQKEFGASRDRESAKWAKEEAADALKEYRSACLLLGHLLCDPPGDAPYKPEWEWPVELAPWLDRVIRDCERA